MLHHSPQACTTPIPVTPPRPTHVASLVVLATGGIAAALGWMVLVGWYMQSVTLVQVLPTLVPMQYNTAWGFLLCGLALFALARGWARLVVACGIVVALVGLLTLGEYLFGISLGLDQFFMQPFITVNTSHPGRMAPNTALCFLLAGIALVVMGRPQHQTLPRLIGGLVGAMIFAFGLVASLGYLTGLQTAYSWEPFTDMALHTALGFVVLGAGMLTYVRLQHQCHTDGMSPQRPLLVGICVTTVTLCLWQALLAYEHVLVKKTVGFAATGVQTKVAESLTARIQAVKRLGKRWEVDGPPSKEAWKAEVALYRQHDPSLDVVAWIDPSFSLRWLVPRAGHELLAGQSVEVSEQQRQQLARARDRQEVIITRTSQGIPPAQGLQVSVPLLQGEDFAGFLVSILQIQALLNHSIANVANDFAVTVYDGDEVIYSHNQDNRRFEDTWGQEVHIDLPGLFWRIRLWPTSALLVDKLSALPTIVLCMGLLTSVLLAALLYTNQTAQLHARLLEQTNTDLQHHITDREHVEAALRTSHQFLQSVLDALPAHVAILDEAGTIIAVNAAWHRFADANGFPDSSHGVGTNYLEICDAVATAQASEALRVATAIREILAQQRTDFSCEYPCHSPTEQHWFFMCLARFASHAGLRVVMVHEDITALKETEKAMRRHQEALYQSEKLTAMGSLIAGVAHELNNPLSIVIMQSDLLREATTEPGLEDLATEITRAAERCVRIVRTFLTLARQHFPERTQVQLNGVIEDAMQLWAPALRLDKIQVCQHLADNLPTLWADAHQLYQVLINLVTNAQQAMGDTPTPRRLLLTTRADPAHQRVVLEVADTGPGIPPEIQAQIFEPFFTTKPPGVGTGLGLSLCQSIIDGHGGTLSVASQPGQGTTFRVELPIETAALSPPAVPEPETPSAVDGKVILVIDDEPGTTKALAYLFRRDGYEVDIAANGRVALEKLCQRAYDLLLCDLHMPELDGLGLYRELEAHYPLLLQRLIFLTGDTLSAEVKRFLDSNGALHLTKPFRAAEIRRIVHLALQRVTESVACNP